MDEFKKILEEQHTNIVRQVGYSIEDKNTIKFIFYSSRKMLLDYLISKYKECEDQFRMKADIDKQKEEIPSFAIFIKNDSVSGWFCKDRNSPLMCKDDIKCYCYNKKCKNH